MAIGKDIRFWIVLFFVVRLYGITQPPLEVSHNWRQSTVAMVARNFFEGEANIAYPKIDIAGEKSGITGMEFPIFNYLIYGASELFGYAHWYGRLINLFFSSLGIWFFFLLVRKFFKDPIAFYSTFILLFSIWFRFSRKMMPDTFSMSFIIITLYYGIRFLESKERRKALISLFLFTLTFAVGALTKIPSAYLMILFLPFFWDQTILISRKVTLSIAGFFVVSGVYYWYYIWVPHLVDTFGFWHFFMGSSFSQGARELWIHASDGLSNFYDKPLKFIGFAVALFGLIFAARTKDKTLLWVVALSFLSFFVVMLKSGETFTKHDYYIIPFTPILALCAGYGINKINRKGLRIFFLAAIAIELIAAQFIDFRIKPEFQFLRTIEADLDEYSDREDLFLINSGNWPTPMYFAHRKGWIAKNERITDPAYIQELQEKGLKYVLILKQAFGADCELNLPLVIEEPEYKLYRMLPPE